MKKLSLIIIMLLAIAPMVSAQSLFDKIKTAATAVVEDKISENVDFSIVGTWNYSGSSINMESSNTLADLGASATSSTIESKVNSYLEKVGIKAGAMTFTFDSNGAVTIVASGRTISGTYEYNTDSKKLTMTIKRVPISSTVEVQMTNFSLLFKGDALLSFAKTISGSVNISYLSTLTATLDKYEGMQIGFKFTK